LSIVKSILLPEGSRGCQLSFFRVVKSEEKGKKKEAPVSMLGSAMLSITSGDSGKCQLPIFINVKSEKAGRRRERRQKDPYVGKDGKKDVGIEINDHDNRKEESAPKE
jgi:hypothetical protein